MRYAILSDLHANLQAWKAIYADIVARRVDKIICLGDIVGYGPKPAQVLAALYAHANLCVLGNHDAVIAGILDAKGFNPDAKRMIKWTCGQLHARARKFFSKVPLMTYGPGFRCAHGSIYKPEKFYYTNDERVARASWKSCNEPLFFVGHTHKPCLDRLDHQNNYSRLPATDFQLKNNERYIINVGSVGMPRDRDFRASYCLYDAEKNKVSFPRIAYDVEALRLDLAEQESGSGQTNYLLELFDTGKKNPVREKLDFAPEQGSLLVKVPLEVEISQAKSKALLWQKIAIGACALLVVVFTSVLFVLANSAQGKTVTGKERKALELSYKPKNLAVNLLPKIDNEQKTPPAGWSYRLADTDKQNLVFTPGGIILTSSSRDKPIELRLPEIDIGAWYKFQLQFKAKTLVKLQGEMPVVIIDFIDNNMKTKLQARTKIPGYKDNILQTRYTFQVLKDTVRLRLRLRGNFSGKILVKTLKIIPRKLR